MMNKTDVQVGFVLLLAMMIVGGCGTSNPQKKQDFFTSGNREADQRADQRMATHQQLQGESGANARKAGDQVAKKTLYDRLGGDSGIKSIVEDFTARALADPRANWERKGVKRGGFNIHSNQSMTWNPNAQNVQVLKTHLVEFLELSTGGPSRYDGKELKQVHQGMHITNAEFDAVVGDLKATLDKLKVGDKEQKELIAIIESTRPEIAEER